MDKYCIAELKYSEEEKLTIERVLAPKKIAPVIHAHWVEDSEVPWCSNCKGEIPYNFIGEFDEWYSTYCPTCGAIMDEEGNDG